MPGATSENWRTANPPRGTTLTVVTDKDRCRKVCGMSKKTKQKNNQLNIKEGRLISKDYF